jgi:Flp pilus assembly protein TadG
MKLSKPVRTALRHLLQQTHGSSAVELCFVLPVFLLIVVATIDFGNLMLERNIISSAAMDGARLASTSYTGSPPAPISQSTLQSNLRTQYNKNNLTVSLSPNPPTSGGTVTVTVSESVSLMVPGMTSVFFITQGNPTGNPVPISTQCTQQCQF